MIDKLLPCPFCGSESPAIVRRAGAFGVKCTCAGKRFLHSYGKTEEAAIASWNERTQAPAPNVPVSGLRYRPYDCDDWGQIRNADGSMFATVHRPASEEELAEHRRAGTDPYEDIARRLMSTFDAPPAKISRGLPPAVTGQMEIEPDVTAADLGVNAEPDEADIGLYEQMLRDAVEPFLDWLEMREAGAHIQEVRDGLIGVEDVLPGSLVVLGAHPRSDKDQSVLTMGHFRKLQAAYDGKAALKSEGSDDGN